MDTPISYRKTNRFSVNNRLAIVEQDFEIKLIFCKYHYLPSLLGEPKQTIQTNIQESKESQSQCPCITKLYVGVKKVMLEIKKKVRAL